MKGAIVERQKKNTVYKKLQCTRREKYEKGRREERKEGIKKNEKEGKGRRIGKRKEAMEQGEKKKIRHTFASVLQVTQAYKACLLT